VIFFQVVAGVALAAGVVAKRLNRTNFYVLLLLLVQSNAQPNRNISCVFVSDFF